MKYAYEDMGDDQFEQLIVILCQQILGISVKGFAKGTDGGRDAKFVGKAQLFPSDAAPWEGTTIIQAKHSNGPYRSFSESDFFSPTSKTSIIEKEIPRINKLRQAQQLDHYMLFSNRRLTGNTDAEICAHISKKCNIPESSIYLCDVEQLELLLKRYPQVVKLADIDPIDSPLIVSPDELAEIVQALASQKGNILTVIDNPPTPRTPYDKKNELNNMTEQYAKYLRKRYLKDTVEISTFFAAPENAHLLRMYELAIDEFQQKIIAKRKKYQTFDEVMEHITDLLFNRDAVLRQQQHKRLMRTLLFYMYWNCDIGVTDDVETD